MSWIDKILPSGINKTEGAKRSSVPEGVWSKCVKCEAVLYRPDLERNAMVCPKCDHHMRIGARQRLSLFLDDEGREEVFASIEPNDRLRFRDKKKYSARLAAAQKSTGERDALVAMRGTLHGLPIVVVAFEFSFHGGSMGQAVGEKFSQAAQLALKERLPLVCFAASGGARMQEALISLMQMAKTSAVIERMHSEGIPYISVMTDPIYGGVSASLALLGDLNIAEPDARAGFAGPNIIEQTIRQKLPKGFQRSEFLLEHGAIDMIVPRVELRDTIGGILAKLGGHEAIAGRATEEEEEEALAAENAAAVVEDGAEQAVDDASEAESTAVDETDSGAANDESAASADDEATTVSDDDMAVDEAGAAEESSEDVVETSESTDEAEAEPESDTDPEAEAADVVEAAAEADESADQEADESLDDSTDDEESSDKKSDA